MVLRRGADRQGQHDEGTLKTRLRAQRVPGANARTWEQRMIAQEKRDQLREYRYGDASRYRSA